MGEDEGTKLLKMSDILFRFLTYPVIEGMIDCYGHPKHSQIYYDAYQWPYYSETTTALIKVYGIEYHELFQNFYEARFKLPCKDHLQFVSYAVSNCRDFLNRDFTFLKKRIGEQCTHYFYLIMSCTMISELLHFCLKKQCYKHLQYAAKAFVIVYERYLKEGFVKNGGWLGCNAYCGGIFKEFLQLEQRADFCIVGLQRHEEPVIEIRKILEYSINYFTGLNELTDQEINMIGDFRSGEDPLYSTSGDVCKVTYYDVKDMANQNRAAISTIKKYFFSKDVGRYNDDIFFLSEIFHEAFPKRLRKVIFLDVDLKFMSDIKTLHQEFDKFEPSNVIGIAPDLQPQYRVDFAKFRIRHPDTLVGSSRPGHQGFNTGVVLFDLDRMRKSSLYNSLLNETLLEGLCKKYEFEGYLGHQDFYTLTGMEYSELYYKLDCSWNRQLDVGWRNEVDVDVFDVYHQCEGKINVLHANGDSILPNTE